jgi:hypothetical protein
VHTSSANESELVRGLAADDFLDHGHGGHRLELFRRFRQRLLNRSRVAPVRALHGDADDRPRPGNRATPTNPLRDPTLRIDALEVADQQQRK